MKVVLIGDVQSHVWQRYPETDEQGRNLRLMDTVNELGRIRQLCTKNKVDVVCVLGDIFEARNALEINVLNAVYKAFYDYVDHGIRLILLVGNHDRTDVGHEHALEVFKPWCEVVDSPTTLRLPDGDIVAIPFMPNAKRVTRAIKESVTKTTKLLLLHTAVKSLKMPNGKIWGEGISLEDIPRHVYCVLGHYHRYSELRPNRVWYLGSMIQVDQGDASFDKYFAVYDSTKDKMSFHNTHGPRFVSVDVDVMPIKNIDNSALIEKYYSQCAGNFVTIRSIPKGVENLSEVEDLIKKCGARHVEFGLRTQLPMSPGKIILDPLKPAVAMDVIENYVEESDTPLDKEELITVGAEIIAEVEPEGIIDTVDTELVEI
jgi:DNA repair exonuclease SbcCD nuclease subunit